MKKNNEIIWVLVSVILVIGALVGCVLRHNGDQQSATQSQASSTAQNQTVSQPTVLSNSADVLTYTSQSLGIQFDYLKDGGTSQAYYPPPTRSSETNPQYEVIPQEVGNKISLLLSIDNGPLENQGQDYVEVFQKNPGETIEQTLRRVVPQPFASDNCSVVSDTRYPNGQSYFIWDKRVDPGIRGQDDHEYTAKDGTLLQDVCDSPMPLDFFTDSNFPNTIYYIQHSTQAPSFWADAAHTKLWYETVHLIAQ